MLDKFINEVCKILEINPPQVSVGENHFANTTMLAQCSSDGRHIFLRNKEVNPDIFFSIAHELRHVWQIRYHSGILDDYIPSDLSLTVDEYNLQPAEIDANAFGLVIMNTFFGITPRFDGLSAGVKDRIKEQARIIIEEYN